MVYGIFVLPTYLTSSKNVTRLKNLQYFQIHMHIYASNSQHLLFKFIKILNFFERKILKFLPGMHKHGNKIKIHMCMR